MVGKAEHTQGEANPRFVVTSLSQQRADARALYEDLYCARGEMENRIKECQLDLFADRTSTATMRANQLRLWFASMAYVLLEAVRRLALMATKLANATCGTIRLKLLRIGALVRISVRRVKIAMASGNPDQRDWALAYAALGARADTNRQRTDIRRRPASASLTCPIPFNHPLLPADERGAPGQAAADTLEQQQIALLDAAVLDRGVERQRESTRPTCWRGGRR